MPGNGKCRHGHRWTYSEPKGTGTAVSVKWTTRSTTGYGSAFSPKSVKWHGLHKGESVKVLKNSADGDPYVEWLNTSRAMDSVEPLTFVGKVHSLFATDRHDGTLAVRMTGISLDLVPVNGTSVDVRLMSKDGEKLTTYLDCGRYHWRLERTCTREEYGSMCLMGVKGRSLDNVVVEGPPGWTK